MLRPYCKKPEKLDKDEFWCTLIVDNQCEKKGDTRSVLVDGCHISDNAAVSAAYYFDRHPDELLMSEFDIMTIKVEGNNETAEFRLRASKTWDARRV